MEAVDKLLTFSDKAFEKSMPIYGKDKVGVSIVGNITITLNSSSGGFDITINGWLHKEKKIVSLVIELKNTDKEPIYSHVISFGKEHFTQKNSDSKVYIEYSSSLNNVGPGRVRKTDSFSITEISTKDE